MRLQKKRRRRIAAKKRLWRNVRVPVTAQCSKEATVSMHTQATRPLYPSKKTAQNATTTPSLEHKGGEDRRVCFGQQGHRKRNTQLQGKEGGRGESSLLFRTHAICMSLLSICTTLHASQIRRRRRVAPDALPLILFILCKSVARKFQMHLLDNLARRRSVAQTTSTFARRTKGEGGAQINFSPFLSGILPAEVVKWVHAAFLPLQLRSYLMAS